MKFLATLSVNSTTGTITGNVIHSSPALTEDTLDDIKRAYRRGLEEREFYPVGETTILSITRLDE